ncbi:MAG: prepilin-type N-terminal cleavage/methylation domain-containing protein [Akkermansiaceae bacterium]|nr:prepilin-type N-terminal cleavage/methylation domain-containing protein [Armatimonadota bacterium]
MVRTRRNLYGGLALAKRSAFATAKRSAFTLIEVLVVVVLVSLSLVAVMNALRTMGATDARVQDAELLQRLAALKMAEIGTVSDPRTMDGSGDFAEQGYPGIEWQMATEPSGAENVDQVTITAERGDAEQSLVGLVFIRPVTTGAAPTGAAAGATTP